MEGKKPLLLVDPDPRNVAVFSGPAGVSGQKTGNETGQRGKADRSIFSYTRNTVTGTNYNFPFMLTQHI